jgi:hypothetical protein
MSCWLDYDRSSHFGVTPLDDAHDDKDSDKGDGLPCKFKPIEILSGVK